MVVDASTCIVEDAFDLPMVVAGLTTEPILSEGLPFQGTASFLPSPSLNPFTSYVNHNGLDWGYSLKSLKIS